MNSKLIKRFFNEPRSSYFLFGPRGTGKSTWMQVKHQDAIWIDFLNPQTVRQFIAHPERLFEIVNAESFKDTIVLDEIQRVPDILTVVHSLIEQKEGKQFILTGSSARKLKRSGVDLLAGRAVVRTLHPFMASEIKEHFDLTSALKFGLLPLVLDADEPSDVLAAYALTYLQEEVQAEGLVRNIGNFHRFLEVISFSHASILNVSNIARECEIERKVVEGYVSILEDLLLAYHIPVFTKRAKRQLTSHPKFYIFDSGVYQSLRPKGPLDKPEEIDGHALEGLVAQHLRAWMAYSNSDAKLYFWRTRKGVEVDFVLYGSDVFVAIEVKNSQRVFPKDIKSLRSFKEDYPECKTVLLYRGNTRLEINDVLCIPCDEFLLQLYPNKFENRNLGSGIFATDEARRSKET